MNLARPGSLHAERDFLEEAMTVDAIRTQGLGGSGREQVEGTGSASGRARTSSRSARWGGRAASGLAAAFLLFDAGLKLVKPPFVVEGTVKLGYSEDVIVPLGIVLLLSTLLYLVPRTSPLGVLLLTGYLGGAVASHVRVGDPLLSHVLFPTYVAVLLWGGLWLRDERVRAFVSLRRPGGAATTSWR